MKKWLTKGKRALALVMSVLMAAGVLTVSIPILKAQAAAGDVPDHAKNLIVNDDGTYTIALNVTGDSEKQIQKVNVIVIVDRSGSMNSSSGTNAYVPTNDNGTGLYGLVNGEYVALTRQGGAGNRTFWYQSGGQLVQYTGQRYRYDANASRLEATQAAVTNLSNTLLAYNEKEGNPNDTVEMALVTFATSAQTNIGETTSASTYASTVAGLTVATGQAAGTNWEAALKQADTINFGDTDPTYVIFFSDGAPTFYGSTSGSGQEEEPNMANSYNAATDDAAALASKVGVNNFYTIFAYGSSAGQTYMTNLTSAAGAPAGNNYSASNSAELNAAFAEILESIEMAGIGNVGINDGTTSSVTTTEGEVSNLLTVDENSFKYYRAGGTDDEGNEKYDSEANNDLGEEWAEAPAATFENSAVKWNIEGVLENDVTYTVTFDCWPSQTTLDIVADIKNDPSSYDSLDANIKKYIDANGNLKTNTSATLSYTDTRNGKSGLSDFVNPDPVETSAVEQLAVSKEWHNELESNWDKPNEIVLDVTRDGDNTYTATLNDDNEWKDGVYISIGIMRTSGDDIELLTTGHNFTFSEPGAAAGYKWELDVPTVRPMKINGSDTILVLVDEAHPAPDGATTYTLPEKDGVEGGTYYVDNELVSLTATNERRSSLNILKAVDGEDAPEDAVFPFTLNIVNTLAPDTAPSETEDPGHDSDWWVWISVRDMSETDDPDQAPPVTDAVVSGATHAGGGWYYGVSGQDIVLNVKDGYSIRVNNLPVDSEYTITEGTLEEGFIFDSAEIAIADGIGAIPESFEEDANAQKASGKIEDTNTVYQVTVNNTYELTDIEVTKNWVDGSNQDGIRPTIAEFAELLTLSPAVEGKTPTVVDNGDDTFTITYTGLPRFNNGTEVEYTVTESAIDEYTTTGSPAKDHGTITNTHTPEVTEVTVVKEWDDSDDIGEIRPASINVQLKADGEVSGDPVALNAGNEWTYTWEDLPKYKDGEEIVYTADETEVPSGYDKTGPEKTTAEDGTITFTVTNTYNPTPVKVDPPVQKVITGNEDLYNKGDFTFAIAAVTEGAPMPANTQIINSAAYELDNKPGYYEFGEITFTQPGEYTYKITESGEVDGVTNDKDAAAGKTITFTVTDDGKGNLTVTPTTDQVQLAFTNVYDANGEATLVVSKELVGAAWPAGKSLTFTVAGKDNAPMPEETTATLTSAGNVSFGPIAYGLSDAGKTYEYTITESSFGKGWTGAPDSITATVAVVDNGDGTLGTTVTYTPDTARFTNTYKASGKATIEATKALKGAAWPTGKSLTFTLAGTDSAPMPAQGGETVTLTAAGKATFGEIAYTEADAGKTYTYTISEDGFGTGWTGSGDITATVEVTDKGDGTLETTVTYDETSKGTITNTYAAEGTAVLKVTKELSGAKWPAGKTLTFTLAGEGGTLPTPATTTLNAEGEATFGAITYDESDIGKTYTYTISEDGFGTGWTGSGAVTATVKVTDKGDGTLATEITYDPTNDKIINTYEAEGTAVLEVTKALVGAEWPAGKTLTFTLAGEGGTLPETKTATLTAAGKATFGAITYDESDIDKTYTYTISEDGFGEGWTGSGEVTATVEVTDNGNGTLATKVTYSPEDATITNTYEAEGTAVLEVTKTLVGAEWPAGKTLTFTLAGEGGTLPETKTATLTAAGKATFGAITYDESDIDKTYTYTISEDGFGAGWTGSGEVTATVKVTDKGDGTLATEITYSNNDTITNTYEASGSATLEATKAWSGRDWLDGETVTFTLLDKDRSKYDEQTLSASNSKVTFKAFEYDESDAGKEYTYIISETSTLPGGVSKSDDIKATVKVTDNGNGTLATSVEYENGNTITNTYVAEPVKVILNVNKTLTGYIAGEDPNGHKIANTFTFTLKDSEGNEKGTVTITTDEKGNGTASFEALKFDAVGEYTYTITETAGDQAGMTYDTTDHKVVITVTDNLKGQLEAIAVEDTSSSDGTEVTEEPSEGTDEGSGTTEEPTPVAGEATGEVSIENIFQQTEAHVTLSVTKTITDESNSQKEGTFTFDLLAEDGETIVDTKEITTDGLTGSVDFDELTFEEAGTYKYFIREQDGGEPGFTYDTEPHPVVIVVDNNFETAILDSESTYDNDSTLTELTITNFYKAAETTAVLEVKKTLEDTSGSAPETTFTFVLTDADGNEDTKTVTLSKDNLEGTVQFDEITYTKVGTYTYTIKETAGDTPGIVYDDTVYNVTVNVSDVDAKLVAEVSYEAVTTEKEDPAEPEEPTETSDETEKVDTGSTTFTFKNIYDPKDAEAAPQARKVVDDKSNSAPDETFTFQLLDAGGNVVETVTGKAGYINFSTLTFAKVGTYKYTIKEVSGSTAGFTYDTVGRELEIVVTDAGKGALEAKINYLTDEGEAVITNPYEAEPTSVQFKVEKELNGMNEGVEPATFTFTLSGDVEKEEKVTIKGSGTATFSEIKYTKVGTYYYSVVEVNDGAKGYTYDGKVYTVTVEVKDEGGKLVATPTITGGDSIKFVNTYKTSPVQITIDGTKQLKGRDLKDGEFTFAATIDGKTVATGVNDAAGKITIGPIEFTKPGDYTVVVTENAGTLGGVTYDKAEFTITVKVVDNGDGTLTATSTGDDAIVFINTYEAKSVEVQLKATKQLIGRDLKAGEFSFTVSQGESVFANGKNDKDGNIVFDAIKLEKAGTYKFILKEVAGKDLNTTYDKGEYEVTVVVKDDGNGNLVVEGAKDGVILTDVSFKNTYAPPVPKTGDTNHLVFWLLLLIVAFGAVASGVVIYRKTRKQR